MSTDCHVTTSLDGYLAGPDQSLQDPMGIRGLEKHRWQLGAQEAGEPADLAALADLTSPRAAYVMGRNMFGPVRGGWDTDPGEDGGGWGGWWGDEPPYHAPVFVLTHHPRAPLAMAGGTTFTFVTEGFDAAYAAALDAAAGGDVRIAGGASTIRQALAAGVVDELTLDIAPVLLGAGERLFEGVADPGLSIVETTASPFATHVRYRVGR